jgi:hypothetical protein
MEACLKDWWWDPHIDGKGGRTRATDVVGLFKWDWEEDEGQNDEPALDLDEMGNLQSDLDVI